MALADFKAFIRVRPADVLHLDCDHAFLFLLAFDDPLSCTEGEAGGSGNFDEGLLFVSQVVVGQMLPRFSDVWDG